MRKLSWIVLLFCISSTGFGQGADRGLETVLKQFHQAMVTNNMTALHQHTDKILSYGHSNGWIETKSEFIKNLETGYIKYHSYKEDSLNIAMNDNMANVRFIADINVTLSGKTNDYHLKVLEVWMRKGKTWLLVARQAVK